jgi:hypothetical protein
MIYHSLAAAAFAVAELLLHCANMSSTSGDPLELPPHERMIALVEEMMMERSGPLTARAPEHQEPELELAVNLAGTEKLDTRGDSEHGSHEQSEDPGGDDAGAQDDDRAEKEQCTPKGSKRPKRGDEEHELVMSNMMARRASSKDKTKSEAARDCRRS